MYNDGTLRTNIKHVGVMDWRFLYATIIFGAGASYDSDPSHPSVNALNPGFDENRPPLAKDLFNQRFGRLARQNPAILALVPRLQRAPSVEEELEDIARSMSEYPRVYRQLLAMRHYLRMVIEYAQNIWRDSYIHDISTYHELLYTIDRWQVRTNERVALMTFNYDTLLDLACEAVFNLKLSNVDTYVDNRCHPDVCVKVESKQVSRDAREAWSVQRIGEGRKWPPSLQKSCPEKGVR